MIRARWLAILLCFPLVAAQYTITVHTSPEPLEPGTSLLSLHVVDVAGNAVANTPVDLVVRSARHVFFAGTLQTDGAGTVEWTQRFDRPGVYEIDARVGEDSYALPVHVRGQYMLLFGFIAAILIVLALLLDKI